MSDPTTHYIEATERMRQRAEAAESKLAAAEQERDAALREVYRLNRNVDLCIAHLDLLKASFGDASKCGAAPEADHTANCPLTLSRERLEAAATASAPSGPSHENPHAWIGGAAPDDHLNAYGDITGVCRSCGRALFGGPGGWHDMRGWENCPYPWPDTPFHEPIAPRSTTPEDREDENG